MKPITILALLVLVLMTYFRFARGHGYLMDPPSRSTLWREHFNTPKNYNDNQLNCGGYYNQWGLNRGKCGICGDPYQDPQPRDNESGGKYGRGIISRTYREGQVINVKVMITANHLGWFEFRLCPDGSPTTPVTQECLDRYVLPIADGSGTRLDLGTRINIISVDLKLPAGVTCKQCVIQWRWHVANNYGEDENGRTCKGCGPQEEFYGCADVTITDGNGNINNNNNNNPPTTSRPFVFPATSPRTNRPIIYPVTNAPTTKQPYLTFAPITFPTFAPVTNAPLTNAPVVTQRPQTSAPLTTKRPTYPPFQPITFPVYTNAPTNAPPQTYRPIITVATNKPIATQAPNPGGNNLPAGFVPISPVLSNVGSSIVPVTYQPLVTSRPQITTRRTNPPFFRPPTTSRPYYVMTTRPTSNTFFRPPTTKAPQVNTQRPLITYRPPPIRVTPRTTQKPTTSTSTTLRPAIFNLGGQTNVPATTQKPTTPRLLPITTSPQPITGQPVHVGGKTCFGVNSWRGDPQLDQWCNAQCNMLGGTCPPEFCGCV